MEKLDSFLLRHMPIGMNVEKERQNLLIQFFCGNVFAVLWYVFSYFSAYSNLWIYRYGAKEPILNTYRKMESFGGVFSHTNLFFAILVLFYGYQLYQNFRYHRTGSMSVYLMKRLPDKHEYLRRCVTVPLIMMGIYLLCCVFYFLAAYLFYITFTPKECLLPHQLSQFFTTWIGGIFPWLL